LPVKGNAELQVTILGKIRDLCCPGCQAIATTIVDIGMESYYTYRAQPAAEDSPPPDPIPTFLKKLEIWDDAQVSARYTRQTSPDSLQITLMIQGITCAACTWLIEKQLSTITGIEQTRLSLSSHRAEVVWDPGKINLSSILKAVARIGYQAQPYSPDRQEQVIKTENKAALARIGVAALGTMQVMMLSLGLYFGAFQGIAENQQQLLRWISAVVCTPVYFYAGYPFLRGAWRNIKARQAGMDIPVTIAISGAFFSSLWATLTQGPETYFDSVCMFILFLSLGRLLEMRARHRSQTTSLQKANSGILMARAYDSQNPDLNKLAPGRSSSENITLKNDTRLIPADQLKPGNIVLVKPGETIPGDGVLIHGNTFVNEAMLTGEQLPNEKSRGQPVTGGTINIDQPIAIRITTEAKNSVLYSLRRLLDRAQGEKPSLNQLADKVAGYFVIGVLVIATTVFSIWWQIDPEKAFWVALAVLVVTCPCALSLSTPVAISAGTSVMADHGFLSTNANLIETLKNISHVVFDKTGTLTRGEFEIIQIKPLSSLPEQDCLALAAAMESRSEHPMASAFTNAARNTGGLNQEKVLFDDVTIARNQGIEAIRGGQTYRLGKPSYSKQLTASELVTPSNQGQWLLLSTENQPLAWFQVDDQLRPDAGLLVDYLKTRGLNLHILSGDSSDHSMRLGKTLGIDRVTSGASPEGKLAYIRALQTQSKVLMIGDGLNDAPVLAGSDVSIVMPKGSDLAQIAADGILLNDKISTLTTVFNTVDQTYSVIKQNLTWALLYNLLALPAAAMGWVPPWAAAIGMSTSSLIVVLNALRIRKTPTTIK